MRPTLKILALASALAALPATAFAHAGHADAQGFTYGFLHPLGGLDHMLAMVGVGILAAWLGGRAQLLVPATFVVMMAAGGMLGIAGIDLPFVETGIAASVVSLGVALAFRWSPSTTAAMGLSGFFAVFHGHAHGMEMPAAASAIKYALGFMLATALLHLCGIGLGAGIGRIGARPHAVFRAGGGAIALAGMGIMAGYL